jgi:hypothetical protein
VKTSNLTNFLFVQKKAVRLKLDIMQIQAGSYVSNVVGFRASNVHNSGLWALSPRSLP